ncbi:MAG: radical SAM protein [Actinomycetota bacterium]
MRGKKSKRVKSIIKTGLKVLLVNPHQTDQGGFSNPPLGLLYLASAVRGIAEVQIVDGYLVGREGIFKKIEEFKPDIAGITCLTPGRKKALEIAKYAKEKGAKTFLGGAHPTIMWRQIYEHYPFVDVIFIGEGEETFRSFAKNFSSIPGRVCAQPEKLLDLDGIKFPAWDLIDLWAYPGAAPVNFEGINLAEARIPVIFSRGCTGHCTFCSTWWIWKKYRTRSPKNMVDEIEWLASMGHRHFVFEDDALTIEIEKTKGMLRELIRRELGIAFHATTKVEAFDQELACLLREAGCYEVSIGVESGNLKILKSIGKTITPEDSKRVISQAHKAGLKVCALTMVGNPGETKETINETIRLLQECQVDVVGTIGCVWVLPGTRLYYQCVRKGTISDDFWLGDEEVFVYQEPQFELPLWHYHVCAMEEVK